MGRSRFAKGNQASRGLIVSAGWLLGFSRSRTRGLGSWGEGRQAIAEAESRTLDRRYRITDGIEGSQAGWSAVMADGLQLLGLNPLKGTIDGAPKFWGTGVVGPLVLDQNWACRHDTGSLAVEIVPLLSYREGRAMVHTHDRKYER